MPTPTRPFALIPAATLMLLAACATPPEPMGPQGRETVHAVSASNHLLRFNAGQPQKILERKPLTGLAAGERLVGLDYRVAKGQLYALGGSGHLYRIDPASAVATPVGASVALPAGHEFGFDFNPTVDRIRVVSDAGFNLRLHPDTGAVVDASADQPGVQFDGTLAYDAGDAGAGRTPRIVAAGYTYNKDNEKITTNYALDGAAGALVRQGSIEGTTPVVSPNTGRLFTVGVLGIGRFEQASLDISDVSNTAYAAIDGTRWHRIDLKTGAASFVGTIGGGEAVVATAIEP